MADHLNAGHPDPHLEEEEYAPARTMPQGTQEYGVEHGHEETDINIKPIWQWTIWLFVSTAIVWVITYAGYNFLQAQAEAHEKTVKPIFATKPELPEPRVLPNPFDDKLERLTPEGEKPAHGEVGEAGEMVPGGEHGQREASTEGAHGEGQPVPSVEEGGKPASAAPEMAKNVSEDERLKFGPIMGPDDYGIRERVIETREAKALGLYDPQSGRYVIPADALSMGVALGTSQKDQSRELNRDQESGVWPKEQLLRQLTPSESSGGTRMENRLR